MRLTQQDKRAAKDGFKYVVVRGGKRVAYTTTVAEGKRECGKSGRVVSIAGMTYAAQNPAAKAKRRNPSSAKQWYYLTDGNALVPVARTTHLQALKKARDLVKRDIELRGMRLVTAMEGGGVHTYELSKKSAKRRNPGSGERRTVPWDSHFMDQRATSDAIKAYLSGKRSLAVGDLIGTREVVDVTDKKVALKGRDGYTVTKYFAMYAPGGPLYNPAANIQRRNPSSGAAKGSVEKFITASGQTGWLVYDRHGRRVGLYATKALALEVLASANSKSRNPAASRKLTGSTDIRDAYYKTAEGIYGMERAIACTPITKGDAELKRRIKGVDSAFDKFYEHLNAHYLWD